MRTKHLITLYLEKHASQKRSGKEDARILNKDILPIWGNRSAAAIKRTDVVAVLDSIVDRGSGIMANRTLSLIRKMFNFAIGRDIVKENPCHQVKAMAKENQKDRVLAEEEIVKMWNYLKDCPYLHGDILKMILITGQRPGEVIKMRYDNIVCDSGEFYWTIPKAGAKNNCSHRVFLSAMAIDLTREQRCADFVFNENTTSELAQFVDRHYFNMGIIDKFTPHDLRRTCASHMASMGVDRLTIGRILNHKEAGVTKIYDRYSYDNEKRDAWEQWSIRLDAMLNVEESKNVVKLFG